MAFVVLGIVIGASCAVFRRRVAVMLVLSGLLGVVEILGGIAARAYPWVIAFETFGSIAALQFMYLAVALTVDWVCFRKLIPNVQMAIGRRLRAEQQVSRSLPPELSALVARRSFFFSMDVADDRVLAPRNRPCQSPKGPLRSQP